MCSVGTASSVRLPQARLQTEPIPVDHVGHGDGPNDTAVVVEHGDPMPQNHR